jgi:hypothetical protein
MTASMRVEDGGRAKVVEELVIKAIHSEGEKQAKSAGRCHLDGPDRLFPDRSLITFQLLKTLRTYVDGLEVSKSAFWEWENAIFDGCEIFSQLRKKKQGTVYVDLRQRKLTFNPLVCASLQAVTVGLGMGSAPASATIDEAGRRLSVDELDWAAGKRRIAETIAAKSAILEALGLAKDNPNYQEQVSVWLDNENRVFVNSSHVVQQRAWFLRALDYKVAFTRSSDQVLCTATAIADIGDVRR